MNAPTRLPALPVGSACAPFTQPGAADGETPPSSSEAIGPRFTPSPQYRRLFGETHPDQVIVSVLPDPLPADGTCGSSTGVLYPVESHPLFSLLAEMGHPSAASLASIAALRERHLAKGHHPSADAAHGSAWFWHGAHEFFWKASDARDNRVTRRKHLIASAAMIVALIDAEDFQAQQEAYP